MENLILNSDNILSIKGAKKIISCTQCQAIIETTEKKIVVSGTSIEVKKLNLEDGEVSLWGFFNNIKLNDEKEKRTLLKRIFK